MLIIDFSNILDSDDTVFEFEVGYYGESTTLDYPFSVSSFQLFVQLAAIDNGLAREYNLKAIITDNGANGQYPTTSDIHLFVVTIKPYNSNPVFSQDPIQVTTNYNTNLMIDFFDYVSDVDDDTFTFTFTCMTTPLPDFFIENASTISYLAANDAARAGTYNWQIKVEDSDSVGQGI